MPTATGWQSADDLQRDLHERQRERYALLQRRAAEVAFERKHGRPAADLGELERAFMSRSIATVDPSRYLDEAAVRRVLTSATGATATG